MISGGSAVTGCPAGSRTAGRTRIRPGPSCPACGFTRQNLGKTGRLGCPVCYDTFGKTIEEAVGGMQRGPRHIGKVPRRLMGEITAARERGQVEKALGEAIRAEQYEEAARLRDRLRSLNNSV